MKYSLLLITLLITGGLYGQTSQNAICENKDCDPAVFNIKLTAPLLAPGGSTTQARTDEFIAAYLAFKQLKNQQSADVAWQEKYRTFELGGSNCQRYYQLESRFAYEYEFNSAFRAFIDQREPSREAFQRAGFGSSRRAMNLLTRMERNCPSEIKKADKQDGPKSEEEKPVYTKLGQVLGYFDEDGNMLKPLEAVPVAIPDPAPTQRVSKKERIEKLQDDVSKLPVAQQTQQQIADLQDQLNQLNPQANGLQQSADNLLDQVRDALPKQKGLLGKVGDLLNKGFQLADLLPKSTGGGLMDQIQDFMGKGNQLKDKVDGLGQQAKDLQEKLDELKKQAQDAGAGLARKGKDITDLKDKLSDLTKKRDELKALLEDKPRRMLDELTDRVAQAQKEGEDLLDKIKSGAADQAGLKDKLEEAEAKKKALEDQLRQLKDVLQEAENTGDQLGQQGKTLEDGVKDAQAREDLKKQVEDLAPVSEYEQQVADCKAELAALLPSLEKAEEKKKRGGLRLGRILSFPGRMLGKVTDWVSKNKLVKGLLSAIPGVGNILITVDGLIGKGTALAGLIENLTGKQNKLLKTLEGIGSKLDKVRNTYEDKKKALETLQKKLVKLGDEKTGLLALLEKPLADRGPVEQQVLEFVKKQKLLGEDSKCTGLGDLKKDVEEAEEELDQVEPQIEELEEEWEDIEEQEAELAEETQAIEKEANEFVERQEELKEQEEAIREEFGQEVELDPVTVEEFSESFEIERPYWEATFHPDDEVVAGYVGRYFQVELKNAEKVVKLLFGPGEYFMKKRDFRDNYGSVIGAFVAETLGAIKKSDQSKVKLFIQGSADITGQNSFRGNLDESYYFDEINMLPMKGSDENFDSQTISKSIPERGFRNEDLPNLRGQYLRDMIKVYAKKLDPIVLEGSVKEKVNKDDRNAVIYLFLPEEILPQD
jgi:predicted  nucleic acid-binding Zn-ribbon protein